MHATDFAIAVYLQLHCVLSHSASGEVSIRQCNDSAAVFVNGRPLQGLVRHRLHHNDRVFIGLNHVFKVIFG